MSSAEDRLAAQDVMIRYAACIDDGDFDGYRECFAPDLELHGFGPETIRGVDAWLDFVHKALEPYRGTQHMLGPPLVDLRGDQAELRTDLQAQHFLREPRGEIFTLWGTYRSSLVRLNGAWKIRRHELVVRSVKGAPTA